MKLDNVNVSKLQLADLPKFNKCPCELCDDGCFDRAGNQHHPECRRRPLQRSKLSLEARCPLSHYKETFLAATSISSPSPNYRRYPCPPAPDNEIPTSFKNAPMSVVSSQRDHYQTPRSITTDTMTKPAKQKDNIPLSSAVPMETQSLYQAEYVEKPVIPVARRPLNYPTKDSQININETSVPSAFETTTGTHFKSWKSAPSRPYTEMPSVAGHALFPGVSRTFDTTAASSFLSFRNASQAKPIVRLESNGSLKPSGSIDLHTNYRKDYVTPDLSLAKSHQSDKKEVTQQENTYTRRPMNGISQTSLDFRPYSKHQRPPLADTEPFLSQFSIGNSFTPIEKESQYRLDYPGHDTNQHARQPGAAPKDHHQSYIAPTEKMDTLTVTRRDFQPLDISSLPRVRLVPLKSSSFDTESRDPMETMTTSRYHYKSYEPSKSQRRYGELIPNVYIPPICKLQTTTTNAETYQGRPGQPARSFNPEIRTIHQAGEHDHHTNYRMDYHPHGLSLCAAKAYTIAQNKETTVTPVPTQ